MNQIERKRDLLVSGVLAIVVITFVLYAADYSSMIGAVLLGVGVGLFVVLIRIVIVMFLIFLHKDTNDKQFVGKD